MKEKWSDLEKLPVRFDVGSTTDIALSDKVAANVICFTKDGRIILNGEEFPNLKGRYVSKEELDIIGGKTFVSKEYVDDKISELNDKITQLINLLTLNQ